MTSLADADRHFVRPDGIYLLSHSVGLPTRPAVDDALADYVDVWAHSPADAWPAWLQTIERFRSALAGLLGTTARSICPQSNVSSGATKVLQMLRDRDDHREPAPRILMSEHAFPSLGFVCRQVGYEIVFLPADADATDPEVWDRHLSDDVDAVLVTHVHSNTGELVPVEPIVRAARERGVVTIVDVAQSVGVIPIDIAAWGADFVVGSCVKWLCGGPGAGWLWVRDDLLEECSPGDVGWFSHEDPFEFDIHEFRYAPDALRFWGGTPTVLPFAVAARSIEVIDSIGVPAIRAHNLRLGRMLIDACGQRVVGPSDDDLRSGTVIVSGDESLVTSLADVGIAVDHRARGIRVSPHAYNTAADIETLVVHLDLSDGV